MFGCRDQQLSPGYVRVITSESDRAIWQVAA